jgi:hypothetical protein
MRTACTPLLFFAKANMLHDANAEYPLDLGVQAITK